MITCCLLKDVFKKFVLSIRQALPKSFENTEFDAQVANVKLIIYDSFLHFSSTRAVVLELPVLRGAL